MIVIMMIIIIILVTMIQQTPWDTARPASKECVAASRRRGARRGDAERVTTAACVLSSSTSLVYRFVFHFTCALTVLERRGALCDGTLATYCDVYHDVLQACHANRCIRSGLVFVSESPWGLREGGGHRARVTTPGERAKLCREMTCTCMTVKQYNHTHIKYINNINITKTCTCLTMPIPVAHLSWDACWPVRLQTCDAQGPFHIRTHSEILSDGGNGVCLGLRSQRKPK